MGIVGYVVHAAKKGEWHNNGKKGEGECTRGIQAQRQQRSSSL